jgi:hypothetical protein
MGSPRQGAPLGDLMKTVTLSEADFKELVQRYQHAQTTPVLVFGSLGQNTADSAWADVRRFMDELGKKYGYNPRTAKISMDKHTFEAEEA